YGADIAAAGGARNVSLPTDKAFIDGSGNPMLFASDEQVIRTRLGAEGARIQFTAGTIGPFGQMVSGITLPAHWSTHVLPPEEPITPECAGGTLCFAVDEKQFAYGREGLERVRS